jgi:hypothetical protein
MNKSLLTSLHVAESMAHVAKIAEEQGFTAWNKLMKEERTIHLSQFFKVSPGAAILLSGITEHYLSHSDSRLVMYWTEAYQVGLPEMPRFHRLLQELLDKYYLQNNRNFFVPAHWFRMDIVPADHVVQAVVEDDEAALDIFTADSLADLTAKALALPEILGIKPGTDAQLGKLREQLMAANAHLPQIEWLSQLLSAHFFSFLLILRNQLDRSSTTDWDDICRLLELDSPTIDKWTKVFHQRPNVLLEDGWICWKEEHDSSCAMLNNAGYALAEKAIGQLFNGLEVPLK